MDNSPAARLQRLALLNDIEVDWENVQNSGPVHAPTFEFRGSIKRKGDFAGVSASGVGPTKKLAKQHAANEILQQLKSGAGAGLKGVEDVLSGFEYGYLKPNKVPDLASNETFNSIGALHELCAKTKKNQVLYEDLEVQMDCDGKKVFTVRCILNGQIRDNIECPLVREAKGLRKQIAKQKAADLVASVMIEHGILDPGTKKIPTTPSPSTSNVTSPTHSMDVDNVSVDDWTDLNKSPSKDSNSSNSSNSPLKSLLRDGLLEKELSSQEVQGSYETLILLVAKLNKKVIPVDHCREEANSPKTCTVTICDIEDDQFQNPEIGPSGFGIDPVSFEIARDRAAFRALKAFEAMESHKQLEAIQM